MKKAIIKNIYKIIIGLCLLFVGIAVYRQYAPNTSSIYTITQDKLKISALSSDATNVPESQDRSCKIQKEFILEVKNENDYVIPFDSSKFILKIGDDMIAPNVGAVSRIQLDKNKKQEVTTVFHYELKKEILTAKKGENAPVTEYTLKLFYGEEEIVFSEKETLDGCATIYR